MHTGCGCLTLRITHFTPHTRLRWLYGWIATFTHGYPTAPFTVGFGWIGPGYSYVPDFWFGSVWLCRLLVYWFGCWFARLVTVTDYGYVVTVTHGWFIYGCALIFTILVYVGCWDYSSRLCRTVVVTHTLHTVAVRYLCYPGWMPTFPTPTRTFGLVVPGWLHTLRLHGYRIAFTRACALRLRLHLRTLVVTFGWFTVYAWVAPHVVTPPFGYAFPVPPVLTTHVRCGWVITIR